MGSSTSSPVAMFSVGLGQLSQGQKGMELAQYGPKISTHMFLMTPVVTQAMDIIINTICSRNMDSDIALGSSSGSQW